MPMRLGATKPSETLLGRRRRAPGKTSTVMHVAHWRVQPVIGIWQQISSASPKPRTSDQRKNELKTEDAKTNSNR